MPQADPTPTPRTVTAGVHRYEVDERPTGDALVTWYDDEPVAGGSEPVEVGQVTIDRDARLGVALFLLSGAPSAPTVASEDTASALAGMLGSMAASSAERTAAFLAAADADPDVDSGTYSPVMSPATMAGLGGVAG